MPSRPWRSPRRLVVSKRLSHALSILSSCAHCIHLHIHSSIHTYKHFLFLLGAVPASSRARRPTAAAMSTLSFLWALLLTVACAQDTSIVYPTTAAASATAVPSIRGYTYAGCWNETTYVPGTDGARALQDGMQVRHSR